MTNKTSSKAGVRSVFNTTVLVAALGYFVDIYDLQLFNVVSKASLKDIVQDPVLVEKYDYILFLWQMGGMLLGGLLWGILGDLKGRKSILFGSILLYSLANIANGFVTNIEAYKAVRLLAGLGLAGELGAAITLVSEVMTKENRGYGTMLIVTLGALGAVAAALISINFHWTTAYFIGGGLGLLLLFLRFGTIESGMFEEAQQSANVKKGNFLMLFTEKNRFIKYIACILIGLPVWYVIGILIKFSEKFAQTTQVEGSVSTRFAIMFAYIGLSVGDLLSGWLSQVLKSRKKVVIGYLIATVLLTLLFLFSKNLSVTQFYTLCFALGAATGYWALFVTIAAEQFGTNIRATVTTTVPNFVRGGVIPITFSYKAIEASSGSIYSALAVGTVCVVLAFLSTLIIKETFGKELNYYE